MKKLHKLKSYPTHSDKLNFFMAQSKGDIGNLYIFAIRRQFLKIEHQSFDNKWFTVFKWEDSVDDNNIKSELEGYGINFNTQTGELRHPPHEAIQPKGKTRPEEAANHASFLPRFASSERSPQSGRREERKKSSDAAERRVGGAPHRPRWCHRAGPPGSAVLADGRVRSKWSDPVSIFDTLYQIFIYTTLGGTFTLI